MMEKGIGNILYIAGKTMFGNKYFTVIPNVVHAEKFKFAPSNRELIRSKLKELADYHMHVPVDNMQIAEDIHLNFNHMMYRVLANQFAKE